MNVEIINVGTELLLGEIVNTNATYIQKMCKELGFNVYFQTTVGDNHDRFKECLDIAFKRGADCVITTGGLGPTQDDLTKELSAEYLGLELIYLEDEASKVYEKCRFVNGNDDVPDNNFKQAYFPENCFVLENEVGTANGCVMSKDEKMIINLPGPPKEMKFVVDHVLKDYLSKYKQDIIYTVDILTMGIGESKVDEILADLIDHQSDVSIALYASEETVKIRLGCKASNQENADKKMEPIKIEIEKSLGNFIIKEKNLKEALAKIMPTYFIYYDCDDFKLRDGFSLGHGARNDLMNIYIDTDKHQLGTIIKIKLEYHDQVDYFKVPLLNDPTLSYNKLESKIIERVYCLLTQKLN